MTQEERDAHFYRLLRSLPAEPGDTLVLSHARAFSANAVARALFSPQVNDPAPAPEPLGPRRA